MNRTLITRWSAWIREQVVVVILNMLFVDPVVEVVLVSQMGFGEGVHFDFSFGC